MPEVVQPVQLQPQTLEVFDAYIRDVESAMEASLGPERFLWSDGDSKRDREVRKEQIVAEFWSGKGPLHIPSGLIHDWIGAAFAPGAALDHTLAIIQDYDNHKNLYRPEVIDSRLLSRHGQDFQIFLRLLKKKIITVVLDSEHDVRYVPLDGARCYCRSRTTRIAEVDDAGKPNEKVYPPDTGYGFLWRLNSYWRFQERDGGLYLECRAISLTRDLPASLRWIIAPMLRTVPRDALIHTLEATRKAIS